MLKTAFRGWPTRGGTRPVTKTLLVMKLTFFLLTAAFSTVSATGISQSVSFSGKRVALEKVFAAVEQQTGYVFLYTKDVLKDAKPVTLEVRNEPLEAFLKRLFDGQSIQFTISVKSILLSRKASVVSEPLGQSPEVFEAALMNRTLQIDLSGRIVDEENNAIMGASIKVKGTGIGTQSDVAGAFTLKNVEQNAILEISYVGFALQTISVAGRKNILIQLKKSDSKLDEVQILAYGKQTQRYSVGNVTTVTGKEIQQQPVNNPLLALAGRVPGLSVVQNTGVNGGSVTIRIQGQNSIFNGNDPFIVIDGVPYPSQLPTNEFTNVNLNGSPLNFINPDDIESMDILKDADATAIYGSRAANGAILITTKKGKAGKSVVNVNFQQGFGKVTRKVDMMNTRQYLDMRYEALKNDGMNPVATSGATLPDIYAPDLKVWDTTRYTDWQKVLIGQTASYSKVGISMSGGTQLAQYLVGATYNKTTDVFPGDFANKTAAVHFSFGGKTKNEKLLVQSTGSYSFNDNSLPGIDLTAQALYLAPNAPPLYNADTLFWAPNPSGVETWVNPLVYTQSTVFSNTTKNLNANSVVKYTPIPDLEISSNFGYTMLNGRSNLGFPMSYFAPSSRGGQTRFSGFNFSNLSSWIIEPQIAYKLKLSKLVANILVGASTQKSTTESVNLTGYGYASDLLLNSLQSATSITAINSYAEYKYAAMFGRLNIMYDKKYLVNANIRRDGSSRFGDASKFHSFGSVGAGWIFSEENLMKELPVLSFGKLRASYGTTGSDQIADYSYLSTYRSASVQIPYQSSSALVSAGLSNPYLQWEESKKWQGGIDLGFWQDRILLNLTYSQNKCSNQLLSYNLPLSTGFDVVTVNFPATVQNTSWEFMLNTINVKSHDWTWKSGVNLTIPRNKLVSFAGIENSPYAAGLDGIKVGEPIGVKYVYKFAGVDPLTGSYQMFDQNRNPTTSVQLITDQYLLRPGQRYYGGVQNTVMYKDFGLDFLFQFVYQLGINPLYYGNTIPVYPGIYSRNQSNQPTSVMDRWQKPGDITTHARYSSLSTNGIPTITTSNAYYTWDASYIRLKNIAFSWNMPQKWLKKYHLVNAKMYMNAQNLFTLTRYQGGIDPENQSGTALPPLYMWTFGIQVGF